MATWIGVSSFKVRVAWLPVYSHRPRKQPHKRRRSPRIYRSRRRFASHVRESKAGTHRIEYLAHSLYLQKQIGGRESGHGHKHEEKYGEITMLDFPYFTKKTFPGVYQMDSWSGLFGYSEDESQYSSCQEVRTQHTRPESQPQTPDVPERYACRS